MLSRKSLLVLGKLIRSITRIRGGGSAFTGLIIEKLDPNFLKDSLKKLPKGVILVSGTNGKTTTTKIVAELLESQGLRVLTNRTGSNFTRGIVSTLIGVMKSNDKLPFDIAVLELDEAHAVHFVKQVSPRISLFLNVMRDQLDRFTEIDYTARLLGVVAAQTTETVILNRDDPLIAGIANQVKKEVKVNYFGVDKDLLRLFPSDEMLRSDDKKIKASKIKANVELSHFEGQKVDFNVKDKKYSATLKLSGVYNFLNAAAALETVKATIPDVQISKLTKSLEDIEPAFGRGERVIFYGKPVEFILVKNPSGFRLALASAEKNNEGVAKMIAINDKFADGRDMSWLWDVDFSSLKKNGVQITSGIRAYDMALRLQYDEVNVDKIETGVDEAFKYFLESNKGKPMRIYCTYTAMLKLRALATRHLNMERTL